MSFESEVAARREMVRATPPLMQREEPKPTLIPTDQALAMELEAKEDLEARLIQINPNIKNLRDCI